MTDTMVRQKYKNGHSLSGRNENKKGVSSVLFAHAVQILGFTFGTKLAKLRGAPQKKTHLFLVITCFMYENRVLAISLDGWRIGQ